MAEHNSAEEQRRGFLTGLLRWTGALTGITLLYPLSRFSRFTVRPKPQYIRVAAPLPVSGFHAEHDFILFARSDKAWAVSRTCTHLGCRVNFLEDRQLIECPCHQSRFTEEGRLINGPAGKDLPVFPVEVEKDAAGAVTGYVVTV
ncbi:MAG: ubiquinol-cytochrome c reductase iron-sulfur subunit [Candidatus Electrothrix sp. YB6]